MMRPRMGTVLQEIQRQELHANLWSTYLRLTGPALPHGAQPLGVALEKLGEMLQVGQQDMPPVLVGTALWDLLPALETAPPEQFSQLLRAVLDLEVEQARRLRRQTPHAVFPPLPRMNLIRDSDFSVRSNGPAARGTLTVSVEREFDELQSIVKPERWPSGCDLFWPHMERTAPDTFAGALRLPGSDKGVHVTLTGRVEIDRLQASANLKMASNTHVEACSVWFRADADPGNPGWTRIIQTRSVRFAKGLLRKYRRQTLRYWMKSEIACLALQ